MDHILYKSEFTGIEVSIPVGGELPYYYYNNELDFDPWDAVRFLLKEEILFPTLNTDKIILMVDCSDIFAWATSDVEPINPEDIRSLFDHYLADNKFGVIVWCAKQRGEKPQAAVMRDFPMVWISHLENLKENSYDKLCKEFNSDEG